MHGRQGIEGTGRLSIRCPSAVKLALLLSNFNSWWCIYVGGAARWSTQLRTGVLGRNRSLSVDGLLRSARICHNPFASIKLYKLFAVFFAFGWWLVWIQSVEVLLLSFFNRQKWYVGILRKRCSCKTKENQQHRENQITKIHKQTTRKPNHKYTNKQNNQNLGRQTQVSCVNNGSMYNRVKSME